MYPPTPAAQPAGGDSPAGLGKRRILWPGARWAAKEARPRKRRFLEAANVTQDGPLYTSYGECLQRICEQEMAASCEKFPGFFTLLGHTGLGLVLFEGGMKLNLPRLYTMGLKGVLLAGVAILSSFAPGLGLTILCGHPAFPDAVFVGTSLLPTLVPALGSLSIRMMQKTQPDRAKLGLVFGTVSLVTELIALLLFDVIFAQGGDFDGFRMVASPVLGVVLVFGALVLSPFTPNILGRCLVPATGKLRPETNEVLCFVMLVLLVAVASIMYLLGSFLWGCFIAGMIFGCLDLELMVPAQKVWAKQTKPLRIWLLRIFYSCTVGFSLRPEVLFDGQSFWRGSVIAGAEWLFFTIGTQWVLGDPKCAAGWAVGGRAELAFFIAQIAADQGIISQVSYSVVVWAIFWATCVAPCVFCVITSYEFDMPFWQEFPKPKDVPQKASEPQRLKEELEPSPRLGPRLVSRSLAPPPQEGPSYTRRCCVWLGEAML